MAESSWRFVTSDGSQLSVGVLLVGEGGLGSFYITSINDPTQTVYRLPYGYLGAGGSLSAGFEINHITIGGSLSSAANSGSGIGMIYANNLVDSSGNPRDLVLSDFGGFCMILSGSYMAIMEGSGIAAVLFGNQTSDCVQCSGAGLIWSANAGIGVGVDACLAVGYINAYAVSIASQQAPPPVDSNYQVPPAPVTL